MAWSLQYQQHRPLPPPERQQQRRRAREDQQKYQACFMTNQTQIREQIHGIIQQIEAGEYENAKDNCGFC
jgi:hypothetical protein